MAPTKQQLKETIPLYSVLTDLIIDFLEPCIDYDVPYCNHKIAFCMCGYIFEFRYPLYPDSAREKRILIEKFCPSCSKPNKHKSPNNLKWLKHGWRMNPSWSAEECQPQFQGAPRRHGQTKNYLKCSKCVTLAESYTHKYCIKCHYPLIWSFWADRPM